MVLVMEESTVGKGQTESLRTVNLADRRKRFKLYMHKYWTLYALLALPITYFIVFKYRLFLQVSDFMLVSSHPRPIQGD